MLCHGCGTMLRKGVKFCPNCGSPVPPPSYKNKIIAVVLCVIAVLAFVVIFAVIKDNALINKVKNDCPKFSDSITYGVAFSRYFTNIEWQSMYDEDKDENWVMFSGNAEYAGENVEHLALFYFNEDESELDMFYFVVDNETLDYYDSEALMRKIFSEYSDGDNLSDAQNSSLSESSNQGHSNEQNENEQPQSEKILDTMSVADEKIPNSILGGEYGGILGECSVSIYSIPSGSAIGDAAINVEGVSYSGVIEEIRTNIFRVNTNDGRSVYLGADSWGDYSVPENVVLRLYSDGEIIDRFKKSEYTASLDNTEEYSDNNAKPAEAPPVQSRILDSYDSALSEAYIDVLLEYLDNRTYEFSPIKFYIYDIDADGECELIVQSGECNADMATNFYKMGGISMGYFWGYPSLYEAPDGNGIYAVYYSEEFVKITRMTKVGDEMYEQTISEKHITQDFDGYFYTETPEIPFMDAAEFLQ